MTGAKVLAVPILAGLLWAIPSLAQKTEGGLDDDSAAGEEASAEQELEEVTDIMIVTASRAEQPLHEAPAAITVLTSDAIERIPADDFGDLLRNVPGVNVSQMSARDIQITTRGASYNGIRFFGSGLVNYVDEAFWTDVLDSRFWGPSDAYTQLNITLGVHLAGDRLDLSIIGQNILDEQVQQHVFGDIITRKITGQARFRF